MSEKKFPLQAIDLCAVGNNKPCIRIPWSHAEEAYKEYSAQYGTDQSLERLAERGGFGAEEIIKLLYDRIQRLTVQRRGKTYTRPVFLIDPDES